MNAKARNKVVLYFPLLNRAAGNKELLFPLLIRNLDIPQPYPIEHLIKQYR